MQERPQQEIDQQAEQQLNTTVVYIVAEYAEQRVISAAIFNNINRSLQLCSFLDNQHYVNLEAFLIQVNPKDNKSIFKVLCHLPELNIEKKKILPKFQDLDVAIKQNKNLNSQLIQSIIEPKLRFLLKQDPKLFQKEQQNKKSLLALDLLLNQLQLEKEKTNKHQFKISLFDNLSYMKLDKACLNALNIFSKNMERKIIQTNTTLFDIINKCKTAFGLRCLKRWMKQPLQNKQQLQNRLQLVEYFSERQPIRTAIQSELRKMPDLQKVYYIFYRVQSGKRQKCQVSDLMKLYRVITSLNVLIQSISEKGINDSIIQKIHKNLLNNYTIIAKLAGMIEKCIDMSSDKQQNYLVRSDAQPNLKEIKKQIDQTQRGIREEKARAQKYLSSPLDITQSSTYRYVFQGPKKGIVERVKQADQYKFLTAKQTKITFTTDTLIKLCNSLMGYENRYREQQQQVLNKMFKIVAGYYSIMEKVSEVLSQLDVLTGWASLVSTSTQKWSRPEFGNDLKGYQMRHPCVKNCVPNDINISKQKTIILTGPNMGGKSTYIRTIGVCSYLAHLGMFIPALSFQTPIIDSIICRVGASDQQIKGISTFMGQMIETSCMLKTATSKSLVLIDQLGRGTSTNQGFGLSWGICQFLTTKINPFCLFATHFHEMITIEDSTQGIMNMYTACKMDKEDNLQFEYKVFQGKVQKSYGIQVAKMLKFPAQIIQEAQSYLQIYEDKRQNNQYNLTSQQETHVSDLVDQMNLLLVSCDNPQKKAEITQNYHRKIQTYLEK